MPSTICNYFKLNQETDLREFFPTKKGFDWQSSAKRVAHYVKTGIWIDISKVNAFIDTHPRSKKILELLKTTAVHRKAIRHKYGMDVQKPSTLDTLKENTRFLHEFVRSPLEVGSMLPSSKQLARAMVRQIPKDLDIQKRRNILEVGPGTGIFTDKIIKRMNPWDHLDVVEYNPEFAKKLERKYRYLKNVTVHTSCILKYKPRLRRYDYIVSGLPFNSFKAKMVKDTFKQYKALIKKEGKISYFEYLFLPTIKRLLSTTRVRTNLEKILATKEHFYNTHGQYTEEVFQNVPPAAVYNHKL